MADVRCPMCGKSNPAEAETCQYCNAQLKPRRAGSGPLGGADWLGGLRAEASSQPLEEEPADQSGDQSSLQPEDEIPDWLARIRERSQMEESPPEGDLFSSMMDEEGQADQNAPDWMRDLGPAAEPESGSASDLSDWLSSLESQESQGDQEKPAEEGEEEFKLPSWLMDQPQKPSEPTYTSPQEMDEETTSWMQNLMDWKPSGIQYEEEAASALPGEESATPAASAASTPAEPADAEDLAWFESLQREYGIQDQEGTAGVSEQGVTEPESVEPAASSEGPGPAEAGEIPEELPFWLRPEGAEQPPAPEPLEQIELPEWLQKAAEEQAAAPTPQEDDTLSWLRTLQSEQTLGSAALTQEEAFRAEPEAAKTAASDQELPDWLKGGEEAQPLEPVASAEGELPDWLGASSETESVLPAQPLESGLPDWLSSGEPVPPTEPSQPAEEPAAFVLDEGDISQWFGAAAFVPTKPAEKEEQPSGAVLPFSEADLPDWLAEEGVQETAAEEQPVAESTTEVAPTAPELPPQLFGESGLPDWLKEEKAEELPTGEEVAGPGLAPAQLPTWLEKMRPVEAVELGEAAAVDDTRTERAGPLAGLPGILPAEELARRYRKPPVYSIKLRINDRQRDRSMVLEDILAQEIHVRELRPEPTQAPQRLARMVVGLILVLVLLVGSWMPASLPVSLSEQPLVRAFYQQVEARSAGRPVLLAVDYDAGFAGEMSLAALGVVERLMAKNAILVVVSTVPAGPAMAEDLLRKAQQTNPNFSLSERVINLGYLVGGISSLQELAGAPLQAARYDFRPVDSYSLEKAQIAWTKPALSAGGGLAQLGLVIVLTDSVDTGRAWMEQVRPAMGEVPLLLATSAQAAPVLQAYAYSGQAGGMLSGLAGGTAYRQLIQRPGNSLYVWNAYRAGLWLAVILVLFGIVLSGIGRITSRRKA